MKEKRTSTEITKEAKASTPNTLGMPPAAPSQRRDRDTTLSTAELAVGEADMGSTQRGGEVKGASLWRDAWRRLLKNKLSVFGLVVVAMIVLGSLIGPPIIAATTGY